MSSFLDPVRSGFRAKATVLMRVVNHVTNGHLTPAAVSIFGFLMHLPVALLIGGRQNLWAAGLLIIFGLFDILDGALARVQGTTSEKGMLLDASTDRMKEVMLYAGAGYALSMTGSRLGIVAAIVACGSSICVSYVKAKGEAAVASMGKKIPHTTLNRMFSDGLLTFEIRMTLLVAGLIFDQLLWAVVVIAVLASFTAVQRLVKISKQL